MSVLADGSQRFTARIRVDGERYRLYYGPDREEAQRILVAAHDSVRRGEWRPNPHQREGQHPRLRGCVRTERKKYGLLFYLCFKTDGKRRYIPLGRSTDGWTYALAESERQRIAGEIADGIYDWPVSSRIDPSAFAAATCRRLEDNLAEAIEAFERRTQHEALPQLKLLKQAASELRHSLAA